VGLGGEISLIPEFCSSTLITRLAFSIWNLM
jgi:hypothetical protein